MKTLGRLVVVFVAAPAAWAQPQLNIVLDDLLPDSLPGAHVATAVGLECARACDCPAPYPCGGPCPQVCEPQCLRPRGQIFSRGEVSRFGDEIGGTLLEPGFAVDTSATARLTVSPAGASGQENAELILTDPNGDRIVVGATGEWWFAAGDGAFIGVVTSLRFEDVGPLDGRFDGTVPGTVSLGSLGCGAGGTLQYFYSSSQQTCPRGTLVVQAEGRNALCPVDVNCSGTVDGDDVAYFFAGWDRGAADFNSDGGTDGDDAMAFLNAWDAGCGF